MPDDVSLRGDQVVDLTFMMLHDRCALLHDPGVGKTPPVCVFMQHLWQSEKTRSVWAMPKSLLQKNYDELLRFTELKPEEIVIVDGPPDKRHAQIKSDAVVFLMGFKRFSDDWQKLLAAHPDIDALFVDEIHMGYGGHSSARTQSLYSAMRHIKRFVPMTGSLINGRLDTAYPTIRVICPNYYASHEDFINQHGIRDFLTDKVISWRNHEKIATILGRHAIRRSFKDVYGDVEIVKQVEHCVMSPKQAEKYKEFEKSAVLELEDGWLDGSMPGVNMIRCRQILSHPECVTLPTLAGLDPSGSPIFTLKTYNLTGGESTGKDEALKVHLADHKMGGKPLIIFAALVQEAKRIGKLCETEGLRTGVIHGEISTKERSTYDEKFQAGKLDVIIGTPATCSVGYNWGHVDHVIFASIDYMPANFMQATRRAIRGKRSTPLRVTILTYKDTVEDRIFKIVEQKSEDAHKVDSSQARISFD